MNTDLDIAKLKEAAEQGAAEGHAVEVDAPTLLALIADLEAAEAKLERHGDLFVRVGQRYKNFHKDIAAAEKLIEAQHEALKLEAVDVVDTRHLDMDGAICDRSGNCGATCDALTLYDTYKKGQPEGDDE